MAMKNDTKIEEELTFHFKTDMNFTKFDPSTRKVDIFLIGSLWPKYILFKLQKYRGVMFDDTEEYSNFEERVIVITMKNDEKFEEELTFHFKTDMRNLKNVDSKGRKFKK